MCNGGVGYWYWRKRKAGAVRQLGVEMVKVYSKQ